MKYIIQLLGVVCDFLESMIFEMGVLGYLIMRGSDDAAGDDNEDIFYQSGLRYFLQFCQYDPELCQVLLKRIKNNINRKYPGYFDNFMSEENREVVSIMITCSLLRWTSRRTDAFGINKQYKIEVRVHEILVDRFNLIGTLCCIHFILLVSRS